MSYIVSNEKYVAHSIISMVAPGPCLATNLFRNCSMNSMIFSLTHGSYFTICVMENAELTTRRCRSCHSISKPEKRTSVISPWKGVAVTLYSLDCGDRCKLIFPLVAGTSHLLRASARAINLTDSLWISEREFVGSNAYNIAIFLMNICIHSLL